MGKDDILNRLCYTELVYGRINKKLKMDLPNAAIEDYIYRIIASDSSNITKTGKNYYILNYDEHVSITVNSYTYRVITADIIKDEGNV